MNPQLDPQHQRELLFPGTVDTPSLRGRIQAQADPEQVRILL